MSGEQFSGEQSSFRVTNTRIAQGTTSNINLATHKDSANPKFIAKTLRRSSNEKNEAAFENETALLHPKEGLKHHHIVKAHELRTEPDRGHVSLIISRASEGALKDANGQVTRLPIKGVEQVVQQIGSALQYIHNLETKHNNVNPRDILLHKPGLDNSGNATFWLSDFGDAVAHGEPKPSLGGDPLYRAPEKFDGEVTKSGDLYSFGATVYELLTGETPFDLPELSSAGRHLLLVDPGQRRLIEPDMAQKHTHEQVPLFSDRWDESWLRDERDTALRLAVEADVHEALSRYEEGRQESIAAFAAAFSEHLTKAEEDYDRHRTTITSSGKGSGRIFLGDYPTDRSQPSSVSKLTSDPAIRKLPQKDDPRPKKTKSSEPIDRRTVLKYGAGAVGAGLGAWYLVESLINGLSGESTEGKGKKTPVSEPTETKAETKPLPTTEGKSEKEKIPEDQLMSFAEDGILYFKTKRELGIAGEIGSLIGNREAAEAGMVYYQGEQEDGPAGLIAARIGDLDNADYFMTEAKRKGNHHDAGVIAALIGNTPAAQAAIEELKQIGMPDEAGYIAALIGDNQTATEVIKGGTAPIVGEVQAIVGQNQAAQKSMQKWHDKGFYRDAGRIAAILGNDGAVRSEIDNMQNLDKQNPDDIKYRDGWAAYLCAETLWWRERREAQGN